MDPISTGKGAQAGRLRERPPVGQGFWRRYFTFYDTLNEAIPYQQMIRRHVDLLRPLPQEEILDAGTGTGNLALALHACGARVTGIDYVEAALDICRRKAPGVEFLFGDLTRQLELADSRFDKVACCNVIYTLAPGDQENAVRELYRILKPGGTAAITVFGAGFKALKVYRETLRLQYRQGGFVDAARLAVRYSPSTARILYYVSRIKRQQRTGSYTFFTREQFRRLLEAGGFQVELMETTLASQCLLALARKPAAGSGGAPPESVR
jgi:ubiquinone/menaquinone biosynthesis C-methylase UbiE